VKLAVISDTHFPGSGNVLPPACLTVIARSDLVIHAGDLADRPTLEMLQALGKPLIAVHGNADDEAVRAALPDVAKVDIDGLRLVITHNGGPEAGRLARMKRRFRDANGVIFGHSHIPLHAVADDGFFILNPGSATDRRRQPRHSMAEITVVDGRATVAFLAVDEPAGPLPAELIRSVS
jgi:hypothetical protein